jgi:hypothetical protein
MVYHKFVVAPESESYMRSYVDYPDFLRIEITKDMALMLINVLSKELLTSDSLVAVIQGKLSIGKDIPDDKSCLDGN